jgi:hypothetical protein
MKKIYNPRWPWIIGLPAFFSGFLVFYALYQSSAKSTAQTAQLLQDQLIYILSEKDDMELIDFGNFLKNLNPSLALRASSEGKVIISAGDLNETSTGLSKLQALHFEFPNHLVAHSREVLPGSSGPELDILLCFPLVPDPWSWTLLDITACFLMGIGLKGLFSDKVDIPLKAFETSLPHPVSPSLNIGESPIIPPSNFHPAQIKVDKGYLVKFVSENAVALLTKKIGRNFGPSHSGSIPSSGLT